MNTDLLFAIDTNTKEVIVSESPKGTNKVNFIERIGYSDNEILYNAVVTLTIIAKHQILMHQFSNQWIKFVKCCIINTKTNQNSC